MGFTGLDIAIIAAIAVAALAGVGLGFARGVVAAACMGVTIALVLLPYAPLARLLQERVGLTPMGATLSALIGLVILSQVLCAVAIQRPLAPLLRRRDRSVWPRRVDAALGALPGAALGLLLAGLVLAPLAIAFPGGGFGQAVRESRLGPHLLDADAALLHHLRVRPLLQPAVEALGVESPLTARGSGETRQLPFRVATDELAPDPAAEERLLALVNEERRREGLATLELDEGLVPVAHAHATEMFDLGYFAHESPNTGDPFDRLAAADVVYLAAGENLAYAPTVEIAHRGLMDSPGHRANILAPEFGRAGIGVVRSRYHGLMIVQLFRD